MRCLLTGFDAFGGDPVNPSQLAVEGVENTIQLANTTIDVQVTKLILTTCCDKSWSAVEAHIKDLPPDEPFFIVLSGVAAGRDRICLERFALNVRQYRIADNGGHLRRDEFIDDQGPEAVRTAVPLLQLAKALSEKALACDISNYAGSFVCNETYYLTMRQYAQDKRCRGVLFIHFPPADNYAATVQNQDRPNTNVKMDVIKEYTRALTETIQLIASNTLGNTNAP